MSNTQDSFLKPGADLSQSAPPFSKRSGGLPRMVACDWSPASLEKPSTDSPTPSSSSTSFPGFASTTGNFKGSCGSRASLRDRSLELLPRSGQPEKDGKKMRRSLPKYMTGLSMNPEMFDANPQKTLNKICLKGGDVRQGASKNTTLMLAPMASKLQKNALRITENAPIAEEDCSADRLKDALILQDPEDLYNCVLEAMWENALPQFMQAMDALQQPRLFKQLSEKRRDEMTHFEHKLRFCIIFALFRQLEAQYRERNGRSKNSPIRRHTLGSKGDNDGRDLTGEVTSPQAEAGGPSLFKKMTLPAACSRPLFANNLSSHLAKASSPGNRKKKPKVSQKGTDLYQALTEGHVLTDTEIDAVLADLAERCVQLSSDQKKVYDDMPNIPGLVTYRDTDMMRHRIRSFHKDDNGPDFYP